MKKTNYLYGIEPNELEEMMYFEALRYKRDKGLRLYRKLFLTPERTYDEDVQLFHVAKAMKHTQKLLDEITVQ